MPRRSLNPDTPRVSHHRSSRPQSPPLSRLRRSVSSSPVLSKRSSPRVKLVSPKPSPAKSSSRRKSKLADGAAQAAAAAFSGDSKDARTQGPPEDADVSEKQGDDVVEKLEVEPADAGNGQANVAPTGDGEGEVDATDGEGMASGSEEDGEDESDDEGNGSAEALAEGFYEVEAVRKKRVRKGLAQYFIKWRGWPESANTWEPFDNVRACADIIEEFEKSYTGKQTRRGRSKRKYGTYLLPQKRKRSFSGNSEEGNIPNTCTNSVRGDEYVRKVESDPADISRESPEGLQHEGNSTDAERKTVQAESNSEDLDVAGPDFGLEVDQEKSKEKMSDTEIGKEAVLFTAIVSQQEAENGFVTSDVVQTDMSPNKRLQEKTPLSVGGESGSPSPFVDEVTGVVCKEMPMQDNLANGHHESGEELMQAEIGCSEQKLSIPPEGVVLEQTTPKELGGHSSTSRSEKKPAGGDVGKASNNDKCTGAKKRKQGFVRRVRQSLDSQEPDTKVLLDEEKAKDSEQASEQAKVSRGLELGMQEDRKDQLGSQLPQLHIQDPEASAFTSPTSPQGSQLNTPTGPPLHVTKIIKAVNYSNASLNGKPDVAVLFKALREDGREVLVDNKFMRANYPILLIDFYEQHLRYSPSTAV